MKKRFNSKKALNPIKSVLLGIMTLILSFLVISFVIALIAYNTADPTAKTGLLSMLSFIISGAVGAFINMKLFGKENGMLPIFSSMITLLMFLLVALISCGKISGGNLMSALCFALTTIFALFVAKRKPAKHMHRKRI